MNNELIEQPIPKLIRKIATPASIGFFFSSMYNVVDTYWAGQLSTTALAAMTLSFPIFFLIIALGSGVGQGVTALVTNALGANDKEKAKTYATQSLTYALIATIILMIVGLFATPYLLQVMNAPSDVAKLAIDYTTIIFLGTFSFIITFAMNSLLNSTGDTKTFRNALVISFV
ncbi:FtsX-like permease family protein, partial [Candidatus Micrarchaeota archaeon]|nr:FtsX-like permease family protein [Candidatus Micrarchaeota archaeon]